MLQVQQAALPTDLFHWILALLPIVVLLIVLVVLRWRGAEAAPIGVFTAAIVALAFFRTDFEALAVASGKGVWDAVFILYVIWPALFLYRVVREAGGFDALRVGVSRLSRSDLFLVLAFAWGFASFLQGISGFGTPIAVVAPLLVAIGVRPLYAVVLPLIGHAWANMFGTLAVGWIATLQVIELQNELQTAVEAAILLWIPNLLGGLAIAWMFGRMPAVLFALPLIVVISAIHGGLQLGLMYWNPILSTFIAAAVGLVAFYPLARWRYAEPASNLGELHVMDEAHQRDTADAREEPEPVMGLQWAAMPYVLLSVLTVGGLAFPPIEAFLGQWSVGFPFPRVETDYGLVREAADPFSPFAVFTHPGTFLLIAAVVTWLVYRSRGYYRRWQERAETTGIWSGIVQDAVPASVAIIGFLVTSRIMDHSGQTETLALGIAAVAPVLVYTFFANWIGVLGAFMTSSNTASNVLFAPLQQSVAAAEAIPESTIIAAQSTGGAIGNTIAPANVVLGTGTAGIVGQEGQVLRKTLPWALVAAVITGLASILLVTVF